MKKLLAMLLVLVAVLGLFAGCQKTGTESTKPEGSQGQDEKVVITIGIPENAKTEDYETNSYTLWLEEQTGFDLKIQKFASAAADYKTQLSTMIVNEKEDLPDMLMNFRGLGDSVWREYALDGYFIPLTPYFEDKEGKSKIFWDRLAEEGVDQGYIDAVIRRCSASDGEIYAFPRIEVAEIDPMDYMVSINQDWLDALKLEVPTDKESLYQVLKAFKTRDPNGNGIPDEMPLIGGTSGNQGGDVVNWLVNMFIYYDDSKWFNLSENGKTLTVPFADDAYREALKFCRKLYDEGLLVTDLTNSELKGLINTSPDANGKYTTTVGMFVGHPTIIYEAGHDSVFHFSAVPIWGYAVNKDNLNSRDAFITEDAKNPDACWELLMLMCTKEGSYRQRYGEKGVDWDDADPGATSFLGHKADIKIMNPGAFTEMNNTTWHSIGQTILTNAENETVQLDDSSSAWDKHKLNLSANQFFSFTKARENNPKYLMPAIVLNADETEETKNERSNTQKVISSYRLNFIKGNDGLDPNNDAHWAQYLNELQTQGLSAWLAQYQRLYVADGYMDRVLKSE
ncbi:MAG: extracellular solute-binding protein [Oscillospiraceae bacterium]|nr:extracellular solute-binding protein [Oscillospiraceae bacterium]